MRHSNNPKQIPLFDPDLAGYSEVALRRLQESWPGIFRHCILELMPVDMIEDRFHEYMGRPTKELYSMCGLVFLMEFQDWTNEKAADAYMFDSRVHFALNLGHDRLSMTSRTIERYRALFREAKCASSVMERVTRRLVELLGTSVERQRLDSTHVFSNMALFGRTRLMRIVVRRFLTQLKRHEATSFDELPADLRARYEQKNWEFSASKGSQVAREEIAEDMLALITRFEGIPSVSDRTTFKHLVRCFHEQCELVGDKVALRKKPGNTVLNNPSDPDATYDGHKGVGYQVQVSETCDEQNEVQLVLAAIPQTACEQDQDAVGKVLDHLEEAGNKPETLLADSGYGSDANHCECAERGVDLIAPVNNGGRNKNRFFIEHFELAADNTVLRCPTGKTPSLAHYDAENGRGSASFDAEICSTCEHFDRCPVHKNRLKFRIKYTAKHLRLAQRRGHFATPECKEQYAPRSGIEGTFSRAKSVMGLGRLRVRGMTAVSMAMLLKLAGINILRALGSQAMQEHLAKAPGMSILKGHLQRLNSFALYAGPLLARMLSRNIRPWPPGYESIALETGRRQHPDNAIPPAGLLLSG
ncbi:MAG: transposase [Lentisphaerae bacterium]|nr:transposase [Lentisphaerota bacterium]MBT7059939.1 transposase [Lentisphaerota bacterium]